MSEIKHLQLTGGCACGAVSFEIDGPVRPIIACHCQTCRKTSGHYWAATQTYHDNLHITEDRGLTWFRSSHFARRGFCATCGSSLFHSLDDDARIAIAAGSLDTPTGLSLVEHVCTAEAGDYDHINRDQSQHTSYCISLQWQLPPRD